MASQMVIPASNDTLFIRGFSSRHHVDDIRDFFTREGGRNTVEFFKENSTGDGLFIALKFESKSIAKEIINRFDSYEVLGDRVSISWYKDIRKAHAYGSGGPPFRQRPQNSQWGADRFDYRGGNNYRGRPGGYNRGSGQRPGWYPRDYNGEGGSRSRRFTRSSSHSRSRSGSGRSHSRSYSRSTSRDDRDSRSRSAESRDRTRKRQRSASDGSRRRSSGRKGKGRDVSSASRSPDLDDLSGRSDSESVTPPPRPGKASKKAKAAQKKEGAASSAAPTSETGATSATRDIKSKDGGINVSGDLEEPDISEFPVDDLALPQPVPPPTGKATRAVRSAISTVDKLTAASNRRQAGLKNTSLEDAIEAANVPHNELPLPSSTKKQMAAEATAKGKKQKPDRRMYEDPISDEDDPTAERLGAGGHKVTRLSKDALGLSADPSSPVNTQFDEPPLKRKVATGPKKVVQKEFDPFENDDDEDELDLGSSKTRARRTGDTEDARALGEKTRRSTAGVAAGLSSATKRAAASREGGVLGLSHDKMLLVRQKKDEIEKAYRQDCETFATVTKMLINKEPSLEDKIQDSLRENLKEIGQRCIHELREFIDRLREEDDADV